jgi:hypothetical protein
MGARPYDPNTGRFLAVDPIPGGSLNNYDYAGQDPINNYDLDGTIDDPNGVQYGIGPIGGYEYNPQEAASVAGGEEGWQRELEAEGVPRRITGYTRHGLDRAIGSDRPGVSVRAISRTLRNPSSFELQKNGTFKLTSDDAVIVVTRDGRLVTAWARNSGAWRALPHRP